MRCTSLFPGLILAVALSVSAQEKRVSSAKDLPEAVSNPTKRAAGKAEAWMKSWRSIEVVSETRQNISNTNDYPTATIDQYETHYIETALGQRFADSRRHLVDGSTTRSTSYCDGKRCANVLYGKDSVIRQSQITLESSFSAEAGLSSSLRPLPLLHFYVGLVPLHEAILKAEFVGEDRVLGRACDAFVFRDVAQGFGNAIFRYVIDRETGVSLAMQGFTNEERRQKNVPYLTWNATKFEDRQGRWCVIEAEEKAFEDADPDNPQERASNTETIKEISFDRDYSKSTFWPEIQPAVMVLDSFKGTQYVTPGEPIEEPQSGSPIRVEAEADPTGLVAWLILGLGAAVLLTGLLLWKRRG